MRQIKFRAPDALLDQLREISESTGVPQATIIRNAVGVELKRLGINLNTLPAPLESKRRVK